MSDIDVISQQDESISGTASNAEVSVVGEDAEGAAEEKIVVHAIIQLRVTDATLRYVHRGEFTTANTLKHLVNLANDHLQTQSARPSVDVKADEEDEAHKVTYDDLDKTCLSEFVDVSTPELTVHVDYTEHPEVLWPLLHALSKRAVDGSEDIGGTSAEEVLRVAIAHFECIRPHVPGFGEHFEKDFRRLEPALTSDHLNILGPNLIRILEHPQLHCQRRELAKRI
ncbi:hypothetical protein PMAYCL1PPCAC_04205, partial [Pristionchus mayeri]